MNSWMIAPLGLALGLCLTTTVSANNGPFQDQGGIVAVQLEAQNPVTSWVEYTQFSGFTGDGYFRWDGPNFFSSPGNGVMRYDFVVNTSGTYRFSLHNRHNNNQPDQENDVWVRMDGAGWDKVYSNLGSSTVNVWNWHTRFDLSPQAHQDAAYTLSAGQHSIYFSGRSSGFMMDRFHLYLPGNPNGTNENFPASNCGPNGGSGPLVYCQSKTSSSGCQAMITTSNLNAQPVSNAGNYEVTLIDAEGLSPGVFFTSVAGTNNLPFMGGKLCIKPPLKRSAQLFAGGSLGQCNGRFSLVINDGGSIQTGDGFDAGPGGTSFVQAWHRDPALNDGFDIVLSNAVRFDWQ